MLIPSFHILLAEKTSINTKAVELESKMPNITNLATKLLEKQKQRGFKTKYLILLTSLQTLLSIQRPGRCKNKT